MTLNSICRYLYVQVHIMHKFYLLHCLSYFCEVSIIHVWIRLKNYVFFPCVCVCVYLHFIGLEIRQRTDRRSVSTYVCLIDLMRVETHKYEHSSAFFCSSILNFKWYLNSLFFRFYWWRDALALHIHINKTQYTLYYYCTLQQSKCVLCAR